MTTVLYIHGKGGTASEAEHYKPLFPSCDVIGLDYKTFTPWETGKEIENAVNQLYARGNEVILIANSIGAFFSMNGDICDKISRAFFISPIVNMVKLIADMMLWAGVTENDLKENGVIETAIGETLSWEYLSFVRNNPLKWNARTYILYGEKDNLQSVETINSFAEKTDSTVTIMSGGEHWFHTPEQMNFLDKWIVSLYQ